MARTDIKEDFGDNVSFCGSFSGENFSSIRRRERKLVSKIHVSNINKLAANQAKTNYLANGQLGRPRWNESFHHFRYIVCIMAGFSFGAMIFNRYIITVAILKMVDQSALYMKEHPNKTVEDFLEEGYNLGGEFVWDNEVQQMIMSWYMFAYAFLQVPCTQISTKLGARISIPICLSLVILGNVLTPILAYYGWKWVVFLRMINGLGASAILPMMLIIIENWMPIEEISLGLTLAQILHTLLIGVQPIVSGYLSSIHWSYAFYVPGAITTLMLILWLCIITDHPEENRLISQRELDYICESSVLHESPAAESTQTKDHQFDANSVDNDFKRNNNSTNQGRDLEGFGQPATSIEEAVPFRAGVLDILRIPRFYFYLVIWMLHCGSFCEFNFILPTYLRQFLKIGISHNGFYCSLIQFGSMFSCLWPHPCLRILQEKFKFSQTAARRISEALVCCVVAATWTFVGLNHEQQLMMFFISRCFHGSTDIIGTGTIMANFKKSGSTGLAFSMINTMGNFFVIITSCLTGYVLDASNQSVDCWTSIFLVGAGMQILMMLLFSTVIDSEPIEFAHKQTSQDSKRQLGTAAETKAIEYPNEKTASSSKQDDIRVKMEQI